MLAKEVVAELGDRVRYADEDFGASELARRHDVKEYPAVFVDDELFARPQDFHAWAKGLSGRYHPWSEPESHRRFQEDLRRAVRKRLEAKEAPPGG
ncbi:MAG TPA: hypothetical protein VLF66_13800 [Thermoanaerobaculia bacterium]|nr:hypothetical protein [Thermoanaerobaculia bacterium]